MSTVSDQGRDVAEGLVKVWRAGEILRRCTHALQKGLGRTARRVSPARLAQAGHDHPGKVSVEALKPPSQFRPAIDVSQGETAAELSSLINWLIKMKLLE